MVTDPVGLPPKMELSGNVRIITFTPGRLRDVENVLEQELESCTDGVGGSHLLLDFTNVVRLASVELGTLVGLHKRMEASGGRLTLFNLNAEVYEVFTATNLHRLLEICRPGQEPPATAARPPPITRPMGPGQTGAAFPGDPDKFEESN